MSHDGGRNDLSRQFIKQMEAWDGKTSSWKVTYFINNILNIGYLILKLYRRRIPNMH